MNKTIIIMEAPAEITGIDQISDEHAFFLGAFGEVIGALKQTFPDGDFSDPTNIEVSRGENKTRIEMNKHTPVHHFIINSEGEPPMDDILKLCKKTGWRALDTETGQFLDQAVLLEKRQVKSWWKFW